MVAACTLFCTAVVIAAAFGRLFRTTNWPVVPTGIVCVVLAVVAVPAGFAGGLTGDGEAGEFVVGDALVAAAATLAVAAATLGVTAATLGLLEALGAVLDPDWGKVPLAVATAVAKALPICAIDPDCVPVDDTAPVLPPDEVMLGPVTAEGLGAAAARLVMVDGAGEIAACRMGKEAAGADAEEPDAEEPDAEGTVDAAAFLTTVEAAPARLTFPGVCMNCTISAIGPVTVIVGIPPLLRRSKLEMTICIRATTTPSISTTRWIAKFATRLPRSRPPRKSRRLSSGTISHGSAVRSRASAAAATVAAAGANAMAAEQTPETIF
ncbi:MAG: hypothetical protein ACLPTF_20500 [Steroidobacteraceae bacterium]